MNFQHEIKLDFKISVTHFSPFREHCELITITFMCNYPRLTIEQRFLIEWNVKKREFEELFERIYSEISSKQFPINQSFRSKFIKATKNNVIRKIYILHFNRIRIDLDTNYLFKNLQRTSTSSNLPGDRGCCKHQIPPVSALWLGAVRCLVYSCSRDHGLWKNGMEKASERHRGTEVVRCRSDRKRI